MKTEKIEIENKFEKMSNIFLTLGYFVWSQCIYMYIHIYNIVLQPSEFVMKLKFFWHVT